MEQMDGGIAIFKNTKIVYRNTDTEYPYRYNSDFYYLTGFDCPEAAFILLSNEDKKSIIEMMVPGNKCFEDFKRAEEVVKEGLDRLCLIIDKNSTWQYKAYYFPYIGHGLGLDVQDFGEYGGY